MTEPLYKCWAKATNKEEGSPRRSHNWVTSKRSWFEIYKDKIECGDWIIPFSEIQEAIVYKTRSLFMSVVVLQLKTSDQTYQFGFNPWANPIKYIPFDYTEEKIKLKHTPLSIMVRLIVVLYLIYLFWKKYY